jgi:ferritin
MKIIEQLCDYIDEEINDAKKYAVKALEVKAEFPQLAETFCRLSQEEMGHMQALHNEVEKIILEYRKEHGDPPAEMKAVYDYLHQKSIDKAKEVKVYQQMYRE